MAQVIHEDRWKRMTFDTDGHIRLIWLAWSEEERPTEISIETWPDFESARRAWEQGYDRWKKLDSPSA
jgi:hypothetical protein